MSDGPDTARGSTRVDEPTRAQRSIGRRAAEARATIPHLELSSDVDLSGWTPAGRSPTPLLIAACARALREFPRANGAYRDGKFESYSRVNIAVTVPTPDAFAVPTIFDADARSVPELESLLSALSARAMAGELTPPELAGTTFVVDDLGAYGVGHPSTILTPGHAASLAAGAVRTVPAVRAGTIVQGQAMTVTLVCDSRILFAADAAALLARIKELLEEPAA
jgi:pyruvate dehydrogenase E2 component (dihydrolipoamide acetyltransferase)